MPWRFPARQRVEALDEKVDALSDRLNDLMSRIGDLSADHHRLSSDVDRTRQSLEAAMAGAHDQADQLSAVRGVVEELRAAGRQAADLAAGLQENSGRVSDAIAELQEHHRRSSDLVADHAARVIDAQERSAQQGRSLDQIRADITRIERQAATDLAELRSTDAALARIVLTGKSEPGTTAS